MLRKVNACVTVLRKIVEKSCMEALVHTARVVKLQEELAAYLQVALGKLEEKLPAAL